MRECDEKGRAVISSLGCQMMCQPSLVEQMKGPVPRLFIPLVLGLTMVCRLRKKNPARKRGKAHVVYGARGSAWDKPLSSRKVVSTKARSQSLVYLGR